MTPGDLLARAIRQQLAKEEYPRFDALDDFLQGPVADLRTSEYRIVSPALGKFAIWVGHDLVTFHFNPSSFSSSFPHRHVVSYYPGMRTRRQSWYGMPMSRPLGKCHFSYDPFYSDKTPLREALWSLLLTAMAVGFNTIQIAPGCTTKYLYLKTDT